MKKWALMLLSALLCMAMLLTMTACGDAKKEDEAAKTEEEAADEELDGDEELKGDDAAATNTPQQAMDTYIDMMMNPTPDGLKAVCPDFVQAEIKDVYGYDMDEAFCTEIVDFMGDMSDDMGTFTVSPAEESDPDLVAGYTEWIAEFDVDADAISYKEYTIKAVMDNGNEDETQDIIFLYNNTYYSYMANSNVVMFANYA